jgi:hypothetical protein
MCCQTKRIIVYTHYLHLFSPEVQKFKKNFYGVCNDKRLHRDFRNEKIKAELVYNLGVTVLQEHFFVFQSLNDFFSISQYTE